MKRKFAFFTITIICLSFSFFHHAYASEDKRDPFVNIKRYKSVEVRQFLNGLQKNIQKNDIVSLSSKIDYPLPVDTCGGETVIKNPSEFKKNYDSIFTDKVKKAVLSQHYEDLRSNMHGIIIGNGVVWFDLCYLLGNDVINENKLLDFSDRNVWAYKIDRIITRSIDDCPPSKENSKKSLKQSSHINSAEIYGTWVVTQAKFLGISSIGPQKARTWYGSKVFFSKLHISFLGEECLNPVYLEKEISSDDFYFQTHTNLERLGINGNTAHVIEINCSPKSGTLGSYFIWINSNSGYLLSKGVYFKLKKINPLKGVK